MDKLKTYLVQELTRNAVSGGLKQAATRYTPPPAPVRSGGGLKSGTPVNVNRGVSGAIKAPVYTPPPPPTITERVAQAFAARPDAREALASSLAPVGVSIPKPVAPIVTLPAVQPVQMGFQQTSEQVPEDDGPLTLYELPSGQDVVMPSTYIPPDDWQQKAEITDPARIANAKQAPSWYENQPTEIQDQIQQPGQQPTLGQVWNPETPRRGPEDEVGLGNGRYQQEAQLDQLRDAFTAGQMARVQQARSNTNAVGIESDFAREQEQIASQDAAARRVAATHRLNQMYQQGQGATPGAIDRQRLQQETEPILPEPASERDWVIVRSQRDGIIRAVPIADYENPRFQDIYGEVTVIGSPITEDQATNINANEQLANPTPDTGMATGDDRQVSLRDPFEEEALNTWRDQVEGLGEFLTEQGGTALDYLTSRGIDGLGYLKDVAEAYEEGSGGTNMPSIGGFWGAIKEAATPDIGIPDWAENLKIPNTDITFGDALSLMTSEARNQGREMLQGAGDFLQGWWDNVIIGPQKTGSLWSIDYTYDVITGGVDSTDFTDDIYAAGMGLIVNTMGGLVPTSTPQSWMLENRNQAIALYNGGVDTDGNGVVDTFGAEAIDWYWNNRVASTTDILIYEIATDPWNATALLGVVASVADDILRSGRYVSPVAKAVLNTLKTGTRVVEGVGSLGAEFIPDLLGMVVKRAPVLRNILANSNLAEREAILEGAEAASEGLSRLKRTPAPDSQEVTEILADKSGKLSGVKLADGTSLDLTARQIEDLTNQLSVTDDASDTTKAVARSLKDRGVQGVDEVPPRFLKPLEAIVDANPNALDDINRAVRETLPHTKFHVVAMNVTYGNGRSFPDAAIDTSRMVSEWRKAFGGLNLPDYVPSTPRQSDFFYDAETIIHTDWASSLNRDARARLYRAVGTETGMSKVVGAADIDSMQAERYADLVFEHLRWHPDALRDNGFRRAYEEARAIRQALSDRGIRPRNSYSRRPYRNRGTRSQGTDTTGPRAGLVATDGGSPMSSSGTSAGAPAPLRRAGARSIPIPDWANYRGDVDGYPIVHRVQRGGVVEEGIQVTETVRVDVRPASDKFEARAVNTITDDAGEWWEAPTKPEALNLAIEDARVRGWLDQPTTPASSIDTISGNGTPAQEAVQLGAITNEEALSGPARLYHWSDVDYRAVVTILDQIRTGTQAAPISPAQLKTPGGRGLMQDVNNLMDKRRAVQAQRDIMSTPGVTPSRNRQAQITEQRLLKDIDALERRIGLKDGSSRERIKRRGEIVPITGDKQAKQYANDVDKITSVRHMEPSLFRRLHGRETGMVVDEGGIAYLATPYGDVPLTPEQLAELTRFTMANGDTTLDRWVKHINAMSGNPHRPPEDIIEQARQRTLAELHDELLKRYPDKQPNALTKAWAGYTDYLRNQILGSWISLPRYGSNTTFGNMGNLMLGGYAADSWKVLDMRQVYRNAQDDFRRTAKVVGADPFQHSPEVLGMDRIANTFGTSRAPEIRKQIRTDAPVKLETTIEAWFTRNGVPRPFKEIARGVSGDSRGLRFVLGMDMQMRDAVYTTAFGRLSRDAIKDFRREARTRLLDIGMAERQVDETLARFFDQHPTGFSAADVQDFFNDYLHNGLSDRLARDWQAAVSRMDKHARQELRRVTFAGKETKLDAAVRPYIMFSYFMSRQYAFLIKQGLRHPGLVISYLEYQDFIDRYMEDNPDLPKWAKGMVRLMQGPEGWSLLLNPMALWQIGSLFNNGVDLEDFNQTGFMEHFGWLVDNPYFFLHPGISNALNVFGFLGDNRAFDPLNIQSWGRYAQLGENWLRWNGWLGDEHAIVGNRVADTGNRIRDYVSGVFAWLPGQEEVEYVESVGREEAELRAIAWDLAVQQGMDPENSIDDRAWLEEQMQDPTSDLYKQAFKQYLLGESAALTAKLVPLVNSFQPIGRYTDRDNEDLMESLKKLGNEEMKQFARTSDNDARQLDLAADRYYALSDDHPYANNDAYIEIVYGESPQALMIDGTYYSPDEIKRMDTDQRKDLALAWLADQGVYSYWQSYKDAETEFLADPENRAFAQKKSWQRDVFDYQGGVEGYWQDVIKHNPNARRYYEGLDPELTPEERQQALTSNWAFMAVAGIQPNVYSPQSLPTNFYDPVEVANKAPQAMPYEPYVSEFETQTRADVEANKNTWQARKYWAWVIHQPEGSDTSLEAYFRWDERQWNAQRPARFNEEYEEEQEG